MTTKYHARDAKLITTKVGILNRQTISGLEGILTKHVEGRTKDFKQ